MITSLACLTGQNLSWIECLGLASMNMMNNNPLDQINLHTNKKDDLWNKRSKNSKNHRIPAIRSDSVCIANYLKLFLHKQKT